MQQCCIIFCKKKRAKGRKCSKKGWNPGIQGTGGGAFKLPCVVSPPTAVAGLQKLSSCLKYINSRTEEHLFKWEIE